MLKPSWSDNSPQSYKVTPVHKDKIISEDLELAKTFKKIMDSLGAKSTSTHDLVDIYILK